MDRHLGHLARWLRTLGQDTYFQVDASRDDLHHQLEVEGSVFVTTSEELAHAVGAQKMIIVTQENAASQLQAISAVLEHPLEKAMFTRCVICNAPVHPVKRGDVRDRVPEAVVAKTDTFTMCPVCDRVYWEGTHTARLRRRLKFLLSGDPDQD